MKSSRFDADMFEQVFEQSELTSCVVITLQVMAVSGVSPRNPDAVRAVPESGQDEFRAHPGRAGHTDDPDIGRVLHAADTCQISGPVTAPITQESRNFRLPIIHYQLLFF